MKNRPLLHIAYLCTLILLLFGCATAKTQLNKDYVPEYIEVELLYATDRKIDDITEAVNYYGSERGELSYGVCTVTIKSRMTKTNFADASIWGISEFETGKIAELVQVERIALSDFLEQLTDRNRTSSDKSAIVYTHGYSRTFEEAATTMAGLVYQMSYQGVPILYSWPSNGSPAAYAGDVNAIDWTTPHLRDFLKLLATQHDVDTIHFVAHSLGNRAFLKALIELLDDDKVTDNWKLGEILLVAPDVDRDIFERDIAPVIVKAPSRITLYVSSVDIPLIVSRSVNLYPRLGDASVEPLIIEGIDTIDATEATSLATGHTYYRETPEVIEDMYYLLMQRQGPDSRPTLDPVHMKQGNYWKIRK